MEQLTAYQFEFKPLSLNDGGGFLNSYPDFANVFQTAKGWAKPLLVVQMRSKPP